MIQCGGHLLTGQLIQFSNLRQEGAPFGVTVSLKLSVLGGRWMSLCKPFASEWFPFSKSPTTFVALGQWLSWRAGLLSSSRCS